ncbi:MAG TPA: DNA polymerase/3'-5' exonuclease PolX [bacterium (Candidatus Stahlbacteria)]|nr:DNA polymerase/3'-5' exonuclease PolX [Candidatus Stahlbacteria bacterium]
MRLSKSNTKNRELAKIFNTMADALEFKGENPFKINAYRKAARILDELEIDISEYKREKDLTAIPGIGAGIAKKIIEYLGTGKIKKYQEIVKGIPPSLLELLQIQNLGPKTLALAHKRLKIKDLDDLLKVIENGSLAQLPQMGKKKVENIRKGIEVYNTSRDRISLYEATMVSDMIISYLKEKAQVNKISPAGSLRRMKETIGDIDILAGDKNGQRIINTFTSHPDIKQILAQGSTKGSVILNNGYQVDLRIVAPASYGAALQYLTGSKAHNIKLRDIAKSQGLKLNEYGLFKNKKKIAGKTEKAIYKALGIQYIPPEMREDRGEIELGMQNKIDRLVTLSDIKGDLQVHTTFSDGESTIEEMARYAIRLGYDYILITDHSKKAHYAHGMNDDRLYKQIEEINQLNRKFKKFRVLKGVEVDILTDGRLDLDNQILKKLDLVIGAIHSGFKKHVTERIIEAMANPNLHIIAHPTGRLISRREGYDIDIIKVIEKAGEKGVALELNAYYDRLDLNDLNLMIAKKAGVMISIGSDAHTPGGMDMIRFGVGTARRAWLTRNDILNCLPLNSLLKWSRNA